MVVNVKRIPAFVGLHFPMIIKINGENVDEIKAGEKKNISIKNDKEVVLTVSQNGRKSNAIKINSNENIIIKNSIWTNLINLLLIFLSVYVLFANIDLFNKGIFFLIIIFLLLIANYVIKSINLQRSNDDL